MSNPNDLVIIRRADVEAFKQEAIFGVFRRDAVEWDKLNALLSNAPVVSGEAVGEIQWSDSDDYHTCYWGELDMNGLSEGKWKTGDKLYTTPQQPQSVADALEEAALIAEKICFGRQTTDDAGSSRWLEAGKCGRQTAEAIRALIKRNANGEE